VVDNGLVTRSPEPVKARRGWKRWGTLLGVAIVVLIVVLALPTWVGGWAPLAHWTCQRGSDVANETVQIPSLLLNSPYGGRVWGNVTFPLGFLPFGLVGESTGDANGGADWAGFQSNITVSTVENQTVWGPGSNVRCSEPFSVSLSPIGNPSLGITLLGAGNLSDQHEPTVLFPGYVNTIYFLNGFEAANSENVSTCGGPTQSVPLVTSTSLTLWAHFVSDGHNSTAAFTVPIVDSQYHYWFPANFGTWQVDNLSAPGGPGGGWAFSYTPCS